MSADTSNVETPEQGQSDVEPGFDEENMDMANAFFQANSMDQDPEGQSDEDEGEEKSEEDNSDQKDEENDESSKESSDEESKQESEEEKKSDQNAHISKEEYEKLKEKYDELNRFRGRQADEVGQLRAQIKELQTSVSAQEQKTQSETRAIDRIPENVRQRLLAKGYDEDTLNDQAEIYLSLQQEHLKEQEHKTQYQNWVDDRQSAIDYVSQEIDKSGLNVEDVVEQMRQIALKNPDLYIVQHNGQSTWSSGAAVRELFNQYQTRLKVETGSSELASLQKQKEELERKIADQQKATRRKENIVTESKGSRPKVSKSDGEVSEMDEIEELNAAFRAVNRM